MDSKSARSRFDRDELGVDPDEDEFGEDEEDEEEEEEEEDAAVTI